MILKLVNSNIQIKSIINQMTLLLLLPIKLEEMMCNDLCLYFKQSEHTTFLTSKRNDML